jgi:hypothetical protein
MNKSPWHLFKGGTYLKNAEVDAMRSEWRKEKDCILNRKRTGGGRKDVSVDKYIARKVYE